MEQYIAHISDPTQVDDNEFGIYENERRVFGSPSIGCALNLWRFYASTPWARGQITIRSKSGDILYTKFKY